MLSQLANLEQIQKALQEALQPKNGRILIGWRSGEPHQDVIRDENENGAHGKKQLGTQDGEDMSELAKKLHYGADRIPARPFFDDAFKERQEEINNILKSETGKEKPNWNKVGVQAVACVREFIESDFYKEHVPNAAQTIELKGSDHPLIDTGQLKNSLTYIVEAK